MFLFQSVASSIKHSTNARGRNSSRGMTLVEITVAVAVFLTAMLSVTQIFITSVKLQRAFLAKTETMNEASYLMEYISRALRMALKDTHNTCNNGAYSNFGTPDPSSISFMTFDGKCEEFYLSGTTLEDKKSATTDPLTWTTSPLTSPLLQVEEFSVTGAGWEQTDSLQPRATISMRLKDRVGSDFILQTTVSQRNPDFRMGP